MKKLFSIIICMLIVTSIIPFAAYSEDNGNWYYEEHSIKWSFNSETQTITVSGNGKMADYGNITSNGLVIPGPANGNNNIKHVIIEEGITYIGKHSFYNCKNIETISLPDSLREIGEQAFVSSCGKLESLEIPAGVRKIGCCAFTSFNGIMENMSEIKFYGNPPQIEDYGLFLDFRGIVYYPPFSSWTKEVKENFENNVSDAEIIWKEWPAPELDHIEEIFLDLEYGAWYISSVDHVYNEKIMKGTDNGFSPNMKVSREQAIQILYNLETRNDSLYTDQRFLDVPENHWASRAIKWAKGNGIVNGTGNGNFGLGEPLTREQLATMLANYDKTIGFDIEKGKDVTSFYDHTTISDWAKVGIEYCVEIGIIKGTDKNTLNPKGEATRAEIAQMMSNYLNYHSGIIKIVFNADKGECDESTRFVAKGERLGELPVPTKEGYEFDGWIYYVHFTATADTVFEVDMELLAKWVKK